MMPDLASPITELTSSRNSPEAAPAREKESCVGGSAGSYLQGRLLGFVVRGTALPSNSAIRVYDATLGPRLAVSLPFVRAFAEAGGGMGHSGYYDSSGNLTSRWGAAWQVNVGFARTILPRVEWRILEGSYGHIYTGAGVSPVMLSTGMTLHVW